MNDSEHRFARRFVIGVTILTLAAGWGGAALIRSAFPVHYLSVFPYIPLGFLLWELLFITLLDRNRGRKRFIWLYMGMKVAKLLLAIVAIGVYTLGVGVQNTDFVLTLMGYYLIYLIYETVLFGKYGKKPETGRENDD